MPFPGDTVIAPAPERPFGELMFRKPGRLRVGLWVDSPGDGRVEVDPECVAAAERAALLLEELGHSVEPTGPPALSDERLLANFAKTWGVSTAFALDQVGEMIGRPLTPDDVEPATWFSAERGRKTPATDMLKTQTATQLFGRAMAVVGRRLGPAHHPRDGQAGPTDRRAGVHPRQRPGRASSTRCPTARSPCPSTSAANPPSRSPWAKPPKASPSAPN